MFDRKTVLVLGAGASWHYGYPTGEGLVEDVISAAELVASHFEVRLRNGYNLRDIPNMLASFPQKDLEARYKSAIDLCRNFASRLKTVSPLVIDYFLGWNSDLADLGRMMIAFALLRRESDGRGHANYNNFLKSRSESTPYRPSDYKNNWIRFVIHQLLLRCKESEQLCTNQLNIITFNYDLSAERTIEAALRATNFLKGEHIERFMQPHRFLHMYGALQPVEISPNGFSTFGRNFTRDEALDRINEGNSVLNACERAAEKIRVIDPHNKADGPESEQAKSLLAEAERIYFLGFGFDLNNVSLLGLPLPMIPTLPQKLYFTNLDNAMSVNRRVTAAIDIPDFHDPARWIGGRGNIVAEKSIRDCYHALALDFGAFEDCSVPG